MRVCIKPCISLVVFPTGFMDYPKFIKLVTLSGPIVSSRGSVTYGVAKVISKVLKPLVGKSPPLHTKYRWLCIKGQRANSPNGWVPILIWCHFTFYFCSHIFSPQHNKGYIGKGWKVKWQNSIVGSEHHGITWVLSTQYALLLSKQILWAGRRGSYVITCESHSS